MGITLRNLCKSSDLKEVITKSELKNKRLWTDKLIEDYLTPLDEDVVSEYSFIFKAKPILFYRDISSKYFEESFRNTNFEY